MDDDNPTQNQLIQIYSVHVYDTHNMEHRTETVSPLKYERTTNTTATLVVKY